MATKLFVGGISFQSTTETLSEHFSQWGTVTDSFICTDRETGNSRGFGFVTFETEEEATKAVEEGNGSELDGRTLRVDKAGERPPRQEGGFRGGRGGGFRGGRGGGRSFDRDGGNGGYQQRDRDGGYQRGGRGGFRGGRGGYNRSNDE